MNIRIFEALGMGGCLLTPAIGHGLTDLFTDGEHLTIYRPNDVDDALNKINALLGDPARCERLARAGLELVDTKHRAHHRAAQFTANMQPLLANAKGIVAARRAKAATIRQHCLKLPYLLWAQEMPDDTLKQRYCAAAAGHFQNL